MQVVQDIVVNGNLVSKAVCEPKHGSDGKIRSGKKAENDLCDFGRGMR